jgi:tetratricopeptide (TPR) repeat protein
VITSLFSKKIINSEIMRILIFLICLLLNGVILAQIQTEKGHINLGDNYFRAAEFEDALLQYTFALEYNPENVETLLKRSKVYSVLSRFQEANIDLAKANAVNPFAGVFLKAEYRNNILSKKKFDYKSQNEDTDSIAFAKSFILDEEYMNLINDSDSNIEIDTLLEFALLSILNGRISEAEMYLLESENLNSETALFYDLKGIVNLKKDNPEMALIYFTKAIELNPKFVLAHHNLAITYNKLGLLAKAKEAFQNALDLNTSISNIYFGKAKLLESMGEPKNAEEYYESAIAIDENYSEARVNYTVLLKASGQFDAALREINQSINNNPDIFENYFIRGGIYFIYGEYDNAIEDFDLYLEIFPDDAEAMFNRGVAKILNQDTADGCEELRESLRLGYEGSNSDLLLFMCD